MNSSRYSLDPFVDQLRNNPDCDTQSLDCFVKVQKCFENSYYLINAFNINGGNLHYRNLNYRQGSTIDVVRTDMEFLSNSTVEHRLQRDLTLLWDLNDANHLKYFMDVVQNKKLEKFPLDCIKFKTSRRNYSRSLKTYAEYQNTSSLDHLLYGNPKEQLKTRYERVLKNIGCLVEYVETDSGYYVFLRLPVELYYSPTGHSRDPELDLIKLKNLTQRLVALHSEDKNFLTTLQQNGSIDNMAVITNFVQELSTQYGVENYTVDLDTRYINIGTNLHKIQLDCLCAKIQINPWAYVHDDNNTHSDSRGGRILFDKIKKALK